MFRNLGSHVDESQLHAGFAVRFPSLAHPLEIRVIRDRTTSASRGYAFAEFNSTAEATAVLEASRKSKWNIDARPVFVAYGAPKNSSSSSGAASRAAAAATAFVEPPPPVNWECPRCGTQNAGHWEQCMMCNIARAVVAHGEAATAAMSTSLRGGEATVAAAPVMPMQQPLLHLSAHMSAPLLPASAAAAAASPAEESLVESISTSKVLFVSSLSPLSTLDSVRDRFSPFAVVRDVLFPLASDVEGATAPTETTLGHAFVVFDTAEDCSSVLQRLVDGCLIDEQSVRVEVASATQFNFALRHRLRSWLAQSSLHAKHRFGSAVAAATEQALQQAGHARDVDWTRVVGEQAAVYADALASNAAIPSRPPGLAPTFLYDMSTGCWHDATSGYYFNAATQLYYHTHSQTYSRWDATLQQYVQTDEHGQPVAAPVSQVAADYLAMKAAKALEQQQAAAAPPAPAPVPATPVSFSMKLASTGAASLLRKLKPAVTANSDATAAAAATAAPPATPSFLDPSRLACLLCQRQLKSLDLLLKHEQQSQLHKDNLAAYHARQSANANATPPTPATAATPSTAQPATASSTGTASAQASPPTSSSSTAASEYLRQMAQFRELERNEGLKRPLMK